MTHQLVTHAGSVPSGASPWTLTARCGVVGHRRAGEPLPGDFSIWRSDVTCDACLAEGAT